METFPCPRCDGPCIECPEGRSHFQHYCRACDLFCTITAEGTVSVAWTIRAYLGNAPANKVSIQDDLASEMWWIKRLAEKYPGTPPTPWRRIRNWFEMRWFDLLIASKITFHDKSVLARAKTKA
jgi:hypothetical protein